MMEPEATDSEFVCPDCGARESSVRVSYGPLGYAICPDCGTSSRPVTPRTHDEWSWSGDLLGEPSD
jgi:predicted RNA-binding Zn-ribbon protein involved in translation (DUF1610 family)